MRRSRSSCEATASLIMCRRHTSCETKFRSSYHHADIFAQAKTSFQKQKLTVTAADRVRSVIFGTLKRLEEAPLEVVKNVDAHASRLIVEPNPDNPGFLICRIPNDIVVPLYGMTGYIDLIIS